MYKGGDICKQADGSALVNDGTDVTVYSNPLLVTKGNTFSLHLVWTETSATYASTVTLWASNIDEPSEADDTDWVEIDAAGGFDGFPGLTAGAMGTSGKDFVDVGNSGALRYRLKFVRTGGAATIKCFACIKDNK